MIATSNRLSKGRRSWASLLLHGVLVMTLVAVALGPQNQLPVVQAAAQLTITDYTGVFAIYDHNKGPTSPGVAMVEARVCNTGTVALKDVTVYIGNGTTPGSFTTVSGYQLLMLDAINGGDTDDATRTVGTLDIGACVAVYWAVKYPTPTIIVSVPLPFSEWGQAKDATTGATVLSNTVNDTMILRDTLTASANKIATTTPAFTLSPTGPYYVGQQVRLCYPNVDFGVIGNGENGVNDLWFQPVGSAGFDPDVMQMVGAEAWLRSSKCLGATYHYTDILYFSHIDQGNWDGLGGVEACVGNSQQIHGEYCYDFVTVAPGTTLLQSYQQASSGNLQKYNNDYPIAVNVTITPECSVDLLKSADKNNVLQGEELTYSIQFTNKTSVLVGAPPATTLEIKDAIPANTLFKLPSTPTCTGGTVYYSTNNGSTWTSTQPTSNSPNPITHVKCVLDGALAANGVGTFSYKVIVQTNNGVNAAGATSNFGGKQCSQSGPVTTTPVTLSSFRTTRDGDTVRFDWSTATETGNVGFNLYEESGNGRRRINAELIPSHVFDSLEPQNYSFDATGITGDRFFIDDVDQFGQARPHGPFDLGQEYGARVAPEPIDWSVVRAEHDAKANGRQSEAMAKAGQKLPGQDSSGTERGRLVGTALSTPIELHVNREGLYRVTYESLLAAGFDLAGARAADLALTSRGAPVPIYVSSGPAFGPGAYLEFYGQALDTLYTDTNVYQLEVNRALAKRVIIDSTRPSSSAPLVPFYMETAAVEQNRQYSNSSPNGDPWYDSRLFAYSAPAEASFGLTVDHYAAGAASSTLSVDVWGMIDWPKALDHHLVAYLNGAAVADEWFDGVTDRPFSASLPGGLLQEGANTLRLRLPRDTGSDYDMVAVDGYSITYPRAFVAINGALSFQATGSRFQVEGLPQASAVVYRLDGNGLAKLTQLTFDGAGGAYRVTFAGSGTSAKYLLSDVAALLVPGIVGARPLTDITSATASYVMIAHPDFIGGLAPLVAARQAEGYTVRVVNVEDIYAQFGFGIFDAQAIRDYVAYATNNMGAQYFLLVGGDTYDYRDYLHTGAMSFIPSLYASTSSWVSFAPVDPLYTDTDGDGMPDRAIGRFPVRTSAELDALVSKTLAYASKDYGSTAVFAADAFDGQRSYAADSTGFIAHLPGDWTVTKAFLDELGPASAKTTLVNAINLGAALTNFVGHSATTIWTFAGLFSATDARNLTNVGRPTVVSQYGCWNNWYVATTYDTLAHALLVSGLQGAAATLGPTTLADSASEAALGLRLTARLVEPGRTVGAAIQAAKADLAGGAAATPDIMLGWVLLGDPTLVVRP